MKREAMYSSGVQQRLPLSALYPRLITTLVTSMVETIRTMRYVRTQFVARRRADNLVLVDCITYFSGAVLL